MKLTEAERTELKELGIVTSLDEFNSINCVSGACVQALYILEEFIPRRVYKRYLQLTLSGRYDNSLSVKDCIEALYNDLKKEKSVDFNIIEKLAVPLILQFDYFNY